MRIYRETGPSAPRARRPRPSAASRPAAPVGAAPRIRVFKPKGAYTCAKDGLLINGELHRIGEPINTRTLSLARLRTLFDAGLINPEG